MAPTESWPPLKHVWTQAIIGLCFVLMLIILIDLTRKFYQNSYYVPNRAKSVQSSTGDSTSASSQTKRRRNKRSIANFYKITTITSTATFTCAVLIDFGDGVHYFVSGIDVFHTKHYWAPVLTNIFFGISTISLYIFMFGRLYKTFKASEEKYHLSKWTIYMVIALIALNAIAFIFYTTCIAMINDFIAIGTFYKWLDASFRFILACDFTLSFIILFLFLYKLHELVLSLDCDTFEDKNYYEIVIREDDEEEKNDKLQIKLSSHQIKMITIMTRHTLLSSIAILFNILFYISIIHGSNIDVLAEADLWFLAYSNLIKALHGLSVACTLYLNFSFNIHVYSKICNKCHFCCYNMFVNLAKNRIRKQKINDPNYHVKEVIELNVNNPVGKNDL